MRPIHTPSITQTSSLWDSFQSISDDEVYHPTKWTSIAPENSSFDSISHLLGIIECAEGLVESNSELIDEDFEPIPIGPNGLEAVVVPSKNPVQYLTNHDRQEIVSTSFPSSFKDLKDQQIMMADADSIIDCFVNSMKHRLEKYNDDVVTDDYSCNPPPIKKQKLSSRRTNDKVESFTTAMIMDDDVPMSWGFQEQEARKAQQVEPTRFRRYQADQWMERFEELVEFKAENGHCLVPHSFPPNQHLAQWVKRQRYQYKLKMLGRHSTLTDARKNELEEMGFVWDSHKAAWDERCEDLKKYRSRFGNCLVPTNYDDDRSLAVWVKCQRRQMRLFRLGQRSTMTQERFEVLDRLGFEWNPRNL